MAEKSIEECLRKLYVEGISLADVVDMANFEMFCYDKQSDDLEDPVGTYGWGHMEGVIDDERIKALEAGSERTAKEMQLFRDTIVRERLSEGEWDTSSAYFWSPPDKFGPKIIGVVVSGHPLDELHYDLFGLFDNIEQAKTVLRQNSFHDCDISADS